MATSNLQLTGNGGKNCNGVSYDASSTYTLSGGTSGTVTFSLAANKINDGKPAEIIGVQSQTIAASYTSQESFSHYISSSDKYTIKLSKNSRTTITYGAATINTLNGYRDENKCFSTAKTITLHIADTTASNGGSVKIKPNSNYLIISWKSLTPSYIHNGTEFVEATPHIYVEDLWVEATPNIYTNGEWKDS